MRLDHYLVAHHGLTRSRAQLLILDGAVSVNGVTVTKVSKTITPHDKVTLEDTIKFVSRAGLKLEHALDMFYLDPRGLTALDMGSSTGGFTDCLLRRGVGQVTCVDVGTDQLHPDIRSQDHVTVFEQTDIRSFAATYEGSGFDLIVGDLSFISLHKIIPEIPKLAHAGTHVILLIKPQFEVGKQLLNRQGIVTNDDAVEEVIVGIQNALLQRDVVVQGIIPSPVLGGDGNREFIISFVFPR